MSEAIFRVEFRTDCPDPIRVGDRIRISGNATVHAIEGDLVDVTELGSKGSDVLLGEVTIKLFSNWMDLQAVIP